MANDVLVGAPLAATGGVKSAPAGTALPVDADTALDPAYVALGLVGEDGVTETADRSTEQIRAWGGSLARVVQTEFGLSYTFQLLDTTATVLREIHGDDNVTVDTATVGVEKIAVELNKNPLPEKVYAIEVKDGDRKVRIVIPRGQITAIGDVTYVHSDVIRYELTISCYPDSNDNEAYKHISRPTA